MEGHSGSIPPLEAVAKRIAGWMMSNMWEPEGRFYYQKGKFLSKKYTLMRWCQSWTPRGTDAL